MRSDIKKYLVFLFLFQICCLLPFISVAGTGKETAQDTIHYQKKVGFVKKGDLVPLPVIFYSPETSLALGGVLFNLFRTVPDDTTLNYSNVRTALIFTLRSQVLVDIDHDIFTRDEKYRITGKLLFAKFPDYFYGIGNQTLQENEEQFNANNFTFRMHAMRQFFKNFYAGPVYYLNFLGNVDPEEGGMLDTGEITGKNGGLSSGIGLIAQWDTRDFNLNSTRGHFLEVTTRHFGKFLGSDFDFNVIELEAMKFFPLAARQVLGLHFTGRFSNREVPFHQLSLLGGDKMMRGYYRGRYRDKVLYAMQAEYRWQFYRRFGLVFFGGLGDVSEDFHSFDFTEIKPSYGFGLRYMILPQKRVNLRLDFGFGKETNGIYINITEAF